ncbi:MAG TPA: flavin reductase family protein [Glaciibacter sp.]|nr:flavin reductase family protein [Glaciibacter sp.]
MAGAPLLVTPEPERPRPGAIAPREGIHQRNLADASGVDDQEFYKRLSGEVAKGVAILSTTHRGRDYAATVTDYLSVSFDPPTMLVSIYSLSRLAEAIESAGRWSLSVLSSAQAAVADGLGEPGAPLIGLLDQIPHSRRDASAPPIVDGALAWFELRTVDSFTAATHTIFVGEVAWLGRPAEHRARPLVRFRSSYST